MKSLTIPGRISKSPASAPSRLLAAPPDTVFLSPAGVFSMSEYVGAAPADKGAARKNVKNDQRQDGQYAQKAPKPDEGRKVGKQEGENEDWKVAAQARLQ